jgi:hypothetical protein
VALKKAFWLQSVPLNLWTGHFIYKYFFFFASMLEIQRKLSWYGVGQKRIVPFVINIAKILISSDRPPLNDTNGYQGHNYL